MPKPKGKKKYSPKQKKLARVAPPRDKITGADFKKLKRRKKTTYEHGLNHSCNTCMLAMPNAYGYRWRM